jgi:hypothetical protein
MLLMYIALSMLQTLNQREVDPLLECNLKNLMQLSLYGPDMGTGALCSEDKKHARAQTAYGPEVLMVRITVNSRHW